MSNRRPQSSGRRMDYGRNDRGGSSFSRPGVSPWQSGGPGTGLPNLLPLAGGGPTEATLALANNLISNLLQTRQQTVPSLLDMPIRRDFAPEIGRFDRSGYVPNRMGNQGHFRRSGNFNHNRAGPSTYRKSFKPGDGHRNYNKSTPKKDADSKAKTVKESETEVKKESDGTDTQNDETKKEVPKTRYDDIDPAYLRCHICNKNMWDGRSFENHLSGRAHYIMMQKTAESYALMADTMRQEFKIQEMKRNRKSGHHIPRDFYCAMCDMYAVDGPSHRTTVGHRKLKKYLHPACTNCRKEMPSRIELDEHRLTLEHLKNIDDKNEIPPPIKPKSEVLVISTLDVELNFVRDGSGQRKRKRFQDNESSEVKQEAGEETKEGDKQNQADEGEKKEGEAEAVDPNLILDYKEGDDLTNVSLEMIPEYSTTRPVGRSFLTEYRCVQCNLCHKLLDTQETAEVHLKTRRHHQLFTRLLKDKSGLEQVANDVSKRHAETVDDREQSGNWKRRKTSPEHDDDEKDGQDQDTEIKEESQNEAETEIPCQEAGEDWEETVDQILQDERQNENGEAENGGEQQEEAEEDDDEEEEAVEEPPKEPTPPPTPQPKATPAKTRGTPRGRARGRGRRY